MHSQTYSEGKEDFRAVNLKFPETVAIAEI